MPTIRFVAASITVPSLFGLGTGSANDDPRDGHGIWCAALSRPRPSALNTSSGRAACHAADAVVADVEMSTTVPKAAKHTGDDGVASFVLGDVQTNGKAVRPDVAVNRELERLPIHVTPF